MQKVAWIIGAKDIGKALALLLARSGYDIAISARSRSNLQPVGMKMQENGDCTVFPCTVLDVDSIEAAYKGIIMHYGRIDLIIYAAGIYTPMLLMCAYTDNSN